MKRPLDRRRFLAISASSLVVAACGPGRVAGIPNGDDDERTGDPPTPNTPDPPETPETPEPPETPTLADTGPALARRVPSSLTSASRAELDLALTVLGGALPAGLSGHVFIVCALPQGDGSPQFNGDGMLMRIDFDGRGARLVSRIARTPCFFADEATRDTPDGFENKHLSRTSRVLGARNFANTALVPFGERMLVTYDGGRPFEIDPTTLEIATAVGRNDEWLPGLPDLLLRFGVGGGPFPTVLSTAHPAVDESTGEIFFVNYTLQMPLLPGRAALVRWDGESDLERWMLKDETGGDIAILQSAHQMVATRHFIVIVDTAFVTEVAKMTGIGDKEIPQASETTAWIVRRDDLAAGGGDVRARRVTLPLDCVHFHADFDDDDGIVLHVAHSCSGDPSEFLQTNDRRVDGQPMRTDLIGANTAPSDIGALGRYVVDADTGALTSSSLLRDDRYTWGGPALAAFRAPGDTIPDVYWVGMGLHAELAVERVAAMYRDWQGRSMDFDDVPFAEGRPGTLFRVRSNPLAIVDGFSMPPGRVALSPTFVPREGGTDAPDDGFIVVTMLSDDDGTPGSSGDELWVFDAKNLAQGPLCRLGHATLDLPFTLHTAFVSSVAPRTAAYRVDVRADHAEAVAELSPELQQMFEQHVYPPFER
jgi:carotenoid cleavage dioxygenase-like enzyme